MTAPADPDTFNDILHRKSYKAFPPRRPGLSQQDVDAMRQAHNPAGDVAPGDVDHVEYAEMADRLEISHQHGVVWRYRGGLTAEDGAQMVHAALVAARAALLEQMEDDD